MTFVVELFGNVVVLFVVELSGPVGIVTFVELPGPTGGTIITGGGFIRSVEFIKHG